MIKWLWAEYESIFEDGSGVMKVHRGKVHKYLGMSLDSLTKDNVVWPCMTIWMESYKHSMQPWRSMAMDSNQSQSKGLKHQPLTTCSQWVVGSSVSDFHTIVAKTLYVTKRARPDTCLAIAFLTTRVRAPDTDDFRLLCIQLCTGIQVVDWHWVEDFPFQSQQSNSWTREVQLRVS